MGSIVGRLAELGAVQAALARAHGGIFAVSLEGEPGIGKTRILQAAADTAAAEGFLAVRVTADEEIRGPFLLARGILASATLTEGSGTAGLQAIEQAKEAPTGRDPPLGGLPPDQRLVPVLDPAPIANPATP